MRKTIHTLIAVILILCMVTGCQNNSNLRTSNSVSPSHSDSFAVLSSSIGNAKIDFTAKYTQYGSGIYTDRPIVHTIKSKETLDLFYKRLKELNYSDFDGYYDQPNSQFNKACASYDNDYFDQKYLVILIQYAASISYDYEILSVRENGDIHLNLQYPPGGIKDASTQWVIFIELDRPYLENDFKVTLSETYEQ